MKKMKSPYLDKEFIIRSNGMVRKALTKRAAEAAARIAKRARAGKAKNDPVGDLQRAKAANVVPKPKPKPRPKPKAITNTNPSPKAGPGSKAVAVPKGVSNTSKAVAGAGSAGVLALALKNKGGSFDDAFRKARAKGEGTKFTHNGKKFTAVTKDDMKNKGYSSLAAYNKAGGAKKVDSTKAAKKITGEVKKNKRPVINAIKKVLLGKDKKFGGDRGLIDFLGKRKKKNPGEGIISKPDKKADGGMMKYKDGGSVSPKRSSKKGVGAAVRGFGKALR